MKVRGQMTHSPIITMIIIVCSFSFFLSFFLFSALKCSNTGIHGAPLPHPIKQKSSGEEAGLQMLVSAHERY